MAIFPFLRLQGFPLGFVLSLMIWAALIVAAFALFGCSTPFYETPEGQAIQAKAEELNVMLESVIERQRTIDAAFDNFVRYNLGWI